MDYIEFFNKTASSWFFSEPALYRTFCLHEIFENNKIDVEFRSGKNRIEYNPYLFGDKTNAAIKKLFKREVTRCALGHPYQRKPNPFDAKIAYQASNLVLEQKKDFLKTHNLLPNQSFEYYYYNLYFEEYGHFKNEDDDSDKMNKDEARTFQHRNRGAPGGLGGSSDDSENPSSDGGEEGKGNSNEGNGKNSEEGNGNSDENTDSDSSSNSESDNGKGGENGDNGNGDKGNANSNEGNGNSGNSDGESNEGNGNSGKDGESVIPNSFRNPDEEALKQVQGDDSVQDDTVISGGEAKSATELWEYDAEAIEDARKSVEEFGKILEDSKNRSTMPYNLSEIVEKKKERLPKHINVLHLFKASVISSLTHLTRMRPSRRSGFLQPGKKHETHPRILCAIDTSGSVSSNTVEKMISVAWGIFKTGIEKLDIVTFDVKINTKRPIPYKARGKLKITGRGGTDFQDTINFFEKTKKYDGLIIMTDGYAPVPKLKFRSNRKRILWFIYGRKIFPQSNFYKVFSQTGFVTSFENPRET